MKKNIDSDLFRMEFQYQNRDKFSYYGYKALFDYYEKTDPDMTLDVNWICDEWTEYDDIDLEYDFEYIISFDDWKGDNCPDETDDELKDLYIDDLVDALERQTTVIKLDNGDRLVKSFEVHIPHFSFKSFIKFPLPTLQRLLCRRPK